MGQKITTYKKLINLLFTPSYIMGLKYLQKNVDITSLSSFKTKAVSKYFYEINNISDTKNLKEINEFASKNNFKILFIGAGTNLFFAFDMFDGIIIKNNLSGWIYNDESKILESYSNELISDIAENLEKDFKQNLWHRFIGLPGSVGGAVYGNAGCFGLETENNFIKAEILDIQSGQMSTLSKINMNFSYRSSLLKENGSRYFLIKSYFDLSKKIEKYHSDVDNIDFRENKQPKGNTCGSFFKNPSREHSAGFLVEQVGLKGHKLGGAFFSDKHANFLMNDGTASYKDLVRLIGLAQRKVKDQFGIDLVNEVRIIVN